MNDEIAITGQTGTFRKLTDGRFFATIEIDPEHIVAFAQHYSEQGEPIAIIRLDKKQDKERRLDQIAKKSSLHGEHAKQLKQSGFFRTPNVWKAIGSDEQFLAWLRTQSCAVSKEMRGCEGDVVAAHVRRIANGAGTGIKPKFSAIPLCNKHHMRQHSHGESALGGEEWFDQQRIKYVEHWAWITLKKSLGFDSWSDVPPPVLFTWAAKNDLEKLLPHCYR